MSVLTIFFYFCVAFSNMIGQVVEFFYLSRNIEEEILMQR